MRTAFLCLKMFVVSATWAALLRISEGNVDAQSQRGLVANIAAEQAATVGIDYKAALAKALAGDAVALNKIFKATPHLDGAGATFNSSRLKQLLDAFGDRRFAEILRGTAPPIRRSVTSALDFYFILNKQRRHWSREYPRTFRLRQDTERTKRSGARHGGQRGQIRVAFN
jgi:hypothetical protein